MLEQYEIRPFESRDRTAFLQLYESVHGETKSTAWFDWKYANNPFAEEIPLTVAEYEGELVGARPLFALPMRRGDWEPRVRQPADAMVHADHRRQGVFTQMIEEAVGRCESDGVDFLFTFPNAKSGGAYRKLGWDLVGELTERFRIHHPGHVLAARSRFLALPGADTIARRLLDLSTYSANIGRPRSVDVTTKVHSTVPVAELNRLYRSAIPNAIHTPRTNRFLEWRYGNPDWNYRTFLGYFHDELTAAIVTGTRRLESGELIARCVDVLPLSGGWRRDATLEVLLADVIDALDDTALFVLPDEQIPADACERRGFWSDAQHPIDLVAHPTLLFVNPLRESAHTGGVTNQEAWMTTFVEYDTA